MAESNSAGALAVRHDQDAFGIVQETWDTGLPQYAPSGWHHNTKNIDPDSGMVYMYQRWYNPHTGTFLSKAPMPVDMEHAYGFTENSPTYRHDARGEYSKDGCCSGNMPSEKELTDRINSTIKDANGAYKNCMLKLVDKMKVNCRGPEAGNCNTDQRPYGYTGPPPRFGTYWPNTSMTICTSNTNNCGKTNLADIMIHEFAHACGMPAEEKWTNGYPGPPWDAMGIPGVPAFSFACDGK